MIILKNITNEVNQETQVKQMPTIKEFASAKMSEGFNFLGNKFGQGKKYVELRKDLITAKSKRNKIAQEIGLFVIKEYKQGNIFDNIPDDFILEAERVDKEIETIERMLANG